MKARFLRTSSLGATACGLLSLAPPAVAQSTLERIQEENVIRVGVADEAPYGYQGEDGRITGEAPEIARKILQEIDPEIEIEGEVIPFGQLIDQLNAGEIDMIAAGMFITPERCQRVAFSDPTYQIGEAFAVQAGNPKAIKDYESIAQHPDARLGVMAGAVEYNYAYDAGIEPERVDLYPDYQDALEALKEGQVDAIGMTSLTVRDLVDDAPFAEATAQFYPTLDGEPVVGYGAFAFREEDADLRQAFNQHLADFIGSEEHWETVAPFGFTPEMAPDKTAEQLCQG